MIDDHKESVERYQDISEKSTDAEIRAYASNELDIIRKHLDQLMSLFNRDDTGTATFLKKP